MVYAAEERSAHPTAPRRYVEASEQDHDDEHEGEDAVVQAGREDDDGDEGDVRGA